MYNLDVYKNGMVEYDTKIKHAILVQFKKIVIALKYKKIYLQ